MSKITKWATTSLASSIVSLIHIDDITAWISLAIAIITFLILCFNVGRSILGYYQKAREPDSDGGVTITAAEWSQILKDAANDLETVKKNYPEISGALDAFADSIKKDQTEVKK